MQSTRPIPSASCCCSCTVPADTVSCVCGVSGRSLLAVLCTVRDMLQLSSSEVMPRSSRNSTVVLSVALHMPGQLTTSWVLVHDRLGTVCGAGVLQHDPHCMQPLTVDSCGYTTTVTNPARHACVAASSHAVYHEGTGCDWKQARSLPGYACCPAAGWLWQRRTGRACATAPCIKHGRVLLAWAQWRTPAVLQASP